LNEVAELNIYCIPVTPDVSHLEISPLKEDLEANAESIFVTKLVSQFGMVPIFLADPNFVHKPSTGASAKHSDIASYIE